MSRSTSLALARALSVATLFMALTAGSVLAGEVTGKGEPTPINGYQANSICSFSGQNDGNPPAGRTAAHVQNWGQIPKATRDAMTLDGYHPGDSCNGHRGFLAGE